MSRRVCPWWVGYFLISPLRRFRQNPHSILKPYVREGQTVLEPGPGMGFFTLELARQVGNTGQVVAVDVQSKMLAHLKRRAERAGLLERIDARLVSKDSMGITDLVGRVDFTLAFAVVHEFPNALHFFREVAAVSKTGAEFLLAEPKGHVKESDFASELDRAAESGFRLTERPNITSSHAAVLKRI